MASCGLADVVGVFGEYAADAGELRILRLLEQIVQRVRNGLLDFGAVDEGFGQEIRFRISGGSAEMEGNGATAIRKFGKGCGGDTGNLFHGIRVQGHDHVGAQVSPGIDLSAACHFKSGRFHN